MKGLLLAISHTPAADPTAAASSSQRHAAAAAVNGLAAEAGKPGSKPTPMQTALQLSSTQQLPQQQRGWGGAAATSPGSAYRTLSIPEAAAGASGGAGGLTGGSSLLGGLGSPLGMPPHASGGSLGLSQGVQQAFTSSRNAGSSSGGGGSFWTGGGGDSGSGASLAAPQQLPAAAAAAAAAGGSIAPSRLSRLSRPGGGSVTVAAAAEAVPMPRALQPHPKAAAGNIPGQPAVARAAAAGGVGTPHSKAADAAQQQDQGLGRSRSGTAGFRSSSEPQSPSTGAGSHDGLDTSAERQPGSSVSPSMQAEGESERQVQQQQHVQQGAAGGRSPSAAAAAAAGSPSAGLATLLQALDTRSAGPGAAAGQAAAAGQEYDSSAVMTNGSASAGVGHPASSCGQQAAVMMDMV
jgi:hypothetical protein